MAGIAEQLGTPLMGWQRLVADVAGELVQDSETGLWVPAYPEVVVTVPRQSGKTTLMLAFLLDRLLVWDAYDGKPQHSAYTAQTGSDGRRKFREDFVPVLKRSPFWRLVQKAYFAAEYTGMVMKNDGRLSVLNSSDSAGHGMTIDMAILDEIFADVDDRREQAMVPAMATRHDRQKLVTSTAGDDTSLLLMRKQAAGRTAVEKDVREGVAYFEWSAEEGDDPEDPDVWRRVMPALGHTITERTVRQALTEMRQDDDLSEFRRAWLNIPKHTGASRPIPLDSWHAATGNFAPNGKMVFGVDAQPGQEGASIVGAAENVAALVDNRKGVSWLEDRLIELSRNHSAEIVIDEAGPAAFIIPGLEAAQVPVHKVTSREYVAACAWFRDAVLDRRVKIRADNVFTAAITAARQRKVGDAWLWARRDLQDDVSPLVACTLALYRAHRPPQANPGLVIHMLDT